MRHRLLGTLDRQPRVAIAFGCTPSVACQGDLNLSASNQMKEARRELERQGFIASKTNGGHWRFDHPHMDGPVFAPSTPSDHRGLKNLQATLRRKMKSRPH